MKYSKEETLIQQSILLYDEVYRFAFSRVKECEAAKDIAQTVMETVMTKIDTVKNEAALKQWIMSITSSKINDYFRGLQKYQKLVVSNMEDQETIEQIRGMEEDILLLLTRRESRKNLMAALLKIDKKYSEVIKQHIIYNNSFHEVAEKLGLNYHTVKTRYKRGISILREEFLNIEKGGGSDDK